MGRPKKKDGPEDRKVELRRFLRIKTMVHDDLPRFVNIGGIPVHYHLCYNVERTDTFIAVRKTKTTIEHHPPSDPLRMEMDDICLDQVVPRPWTYEFLYTFCKKNWDHFSDAEREIIDLYYGEGYTERQIAHLLGILKTAVHRKVEKVRKSVTRIAKYRGTNDST